MGYDAIVRFDGVSLFTNISFDETIKINYTELFLYK